MPDLLLELRSEEIPARMQRKAAGDLRKLVTDGLVEAGLTYEGAQEYWTPRRLALDIRGLTARSADIREERKGPRTDSPQRAIEGFLRSAGLSSVEEAQVSSDPKKGDFYVAIIQKPGRAAEEIIAELMPRVIRDFPWPKSMRWGAASAEPGSLRWVRPLQSILCTFGPETEEPVVVDFEVEGIRSGNITFGHRFMGGAEPIVVKRFDDYAAKLEKAKVVLDAERRKAMIRQDAHNLAFAGGFELVEDEGLLEEVSGLVEWPVPLMGEFEEEFLAIPDEVIRLTIRANQKCFVMRKAIAPLSAGAPPSALPGISPSRGEISHGSALTNRFILVANIEAKDGGREIAAGNGKVVRARLSDALYFWHTDQAPLPDLDRLKPSAEKFKLDLKRPLDQRMAKLDALGVTFHAKLGTQGERVERIRRLAREMAHLLESQGFHPTPDLRSDPPHRGEGEEKGATLTSRSHGRGRGEAACGGEGPSLADLAERAAVLAKADLTTEIVGEFPELQGAMGRKYAMLQGEHPAVAAAIEEHYKPQGPSDAVPTEPVSVAVALADKLDTLVGFWAIDEKPTGSKDPYALRRAALGVIRIVLENGVRLRLIAQTLPMLLAIRLGPEDLSRGGRITFWRDTISGTDLVGPKFLKWVQEHSHVPLPASSHIVWEEIGSQILDLLAFFHDRLKVHLREQGARYDLIDAVLASGAGAPPSALPGISPSRGEISRHHAPRPISGAEAEAQAFQQSISPLEGEMPGRAEGGAASQGEGRAANDDLLMIVKRVEALAELLNTEDGRNLLAGTKRAANILSAEEKKGTEIAAHVDPELFIEPEERTLYAAVSEAEDTAAAAIREEDFAGAMRALGRLRAPIDTFFEKVRVNDEDATIRANRLALLARIRAATGAVADFSKIAG